MTPTRLAAAVASLVLAAGPAAFADRIELRGGDVIKGVVVPSAAPKPGEVLVQTESGSKPVAFTKAQIVRVTPEDDPLDAYFARRPSTADEAPAQHELGLWCEARKLTGLAEVHYRRAVELDKQFAPAHLKLGHIEHDGRWMTHDQVREAQGMVKIKGRWVSAQERERIETKALEKAGQSSWARRIKILHANLVGGTNEEREAAEERLEEIRDPAAIAALEQILGRDEPSMRVRLAHLLGAIPGAEARAALVKLVLTEPEVAVRQVALDELDRRKEIETSGDFLRALGAQNTDVVGRAAWALAGLNVKSAVPKLIPPLVRQQRRTVFVPSGGMMASAGSGSGPIGVTGGGSTSSGFVQTYANVQAVVGPGVVAFGASPVGFASGAGVSSGGGAVIESPPVPRTVVDAYPNPEVLSALESLTGRSFGYNQDAWRQWVRTSFRVENAPARRAPEP